MNSSTRKEIRKLRQSISTDEAKKGSIALLKNFKALKIDINKKKIASYLSVNGEMSTTALHEALREQTQDIYLPILDDDHLLFGKWNQSRVLVKNKFKILEPDDKQPLKANQLDIIFVPLVAFKKDKSRLGMGGGYYDKTLGCIFKNKKPLLIGLAFDFQNDENFKTEKWDIPMDIIVTDKKSYTI